MAAPAHVTLDDFRPAIGTSYAGLVTADYRDLVRTFGEPTRPDGDGDKTDAEWVIRFAGGADCTGVIVTVYNYKDGPAYMGAAGTPVDDIGNWHVGAGLVDKTDAVALVEAAIAEALS